MKNLSNPRRVERVEAIEAVLKKHGTPLHYDMVAVMVLDKYPALFRSAREVVGLLALERGRFRPLGEGVYSLETTKSRKTLGGNPKRFRWPDPEVAFLLGAMCARGAVIPESSTIKIGFRYGGKAYSYRGKTGYIGKGGVSYKAADVVPKVPASVARHIRAVLPELRVTVSQGGPMHFEIHVDCQQDDAAMSDILRFLGPGHNYTTFTAPESMISGPDEKMRRPFLRGFAQVCGLVSAGTNLFGGVEQIWLRPDTDNKPLFYQIIEMIELMGVDVYTNDRDERDIAIKINCEDWQSIGVGVKWIDELVAEGAAINMASGRRRGRRSQRASTPFDNKDKCGNVNIGATVTVTYIDDHKQAVFRIGGAADANQRVRTLSADAPIARALKTASEGDVVTVEAPGGPFDLRVDKISE